MSFTVARLRGLPWEASDDDIFQFFSGLAVTEVSICQDVPGRPSGDAFVRFADAESARTAVTYNRKMMGRRYVEVFESSSDEMARRTGKGGGAPSFGGMPGPLAMAGAPGSDDGMVRLRGLPFSATAHDIASFFESGEISEADVTIGVHVGGQFDGRSTGEAWVQFSSAQAAQNVLESKQRQTIGGRYIELFPSSVADREYGKRKLAGGKGGKGGGAAGMGMGGGFDPMGGMYMMDPSAAGQGVVVKMRGLPYSATVADVVSFFWPDFTLEPTGIEIGQGMDGRPSGEAFVTFTTRDEAERAVRQKQRKDMGSRYIELSIVEDPYALAAGFDQFGGGRAGGADRSSDRFDPYGSMSKDKGAGKGGAGAAAAAGAAGQNMDMNSMMGWMMQMMQAAGMSGSTGFEQWQ